MTRYFVRVFSTGVDPSTKKAKLPPVFPNMFVELKQGSIAFVIARDADKEFARDDAIIVIMRSRKGGWRPKLIPLHHSDVERFLTDDDKLLRGIRPPRRSIVDRLKTLAVFATPNVPGLKPVTDVEERAYDPVERRRRGLCLSCGGEREPKRKARGIWTCERCGSP